jgi:Flp pilus assembly protein TadG
MLHAVGQVGIVIATGTARRTTPHQPVVLVPEKANERRVSGLSLRHLGNTKTLDRSVDFAPVRRLISALSHRFALDERGQSMVELALTLPILVFLLLGGVDIARAYAAQLAVQNGARAGAEATALDVTPTSIEAFQHATQEMNRTPGMDAAAANVTTLFTQVDGVLPCVGATNTSIAGTSTYDIPCYAYVRVQYTFRTITPWPLIPNTVTFNRGTMYRRYQ